MSDYDQKLSDAVKQAIRRIMGNPVPEPTPEPTPEPMIDPLTSEINTLTDLLADIPADNLIERMSLMARLDNAKAKAEHKKLVNMFYQLKPRQGWSISTTDHNQVEYKCIVPICDATEFPYRTPRKEPYHVELLYFMPLKKFVDILLRDKEEREKWEEYGMSRRWAENHRPPSESRYQPVSLDYISQELDKQGYDFIPGEFVAIKRTGMWKVE